MPKPFPTPAKLSASRRVLPVASFAAKTKRALECFAAGTVALPEGELPNRLLIAPWGTSQTDTQPVTVNEATAAYLAKHQNHPFDTVALDFCHNTERPGPEPKPVAAYGKPQLIPGEGLFLTNLEWTPDGEKAWKGRWYKDVSPTIARDAAGVVMFAKSAALCRNGRIAGLENFDSENDEPSYPMKKSLILQVLNSAGANLPDDASDEAIAAAADTLSAGKTETGASTETLSAEFKKTLETFSAEFKKELADLRGLRASDQKTQTEARKRELISQATQAGQVIPFSDEDIMAESFGVEVLEKCLAKLPKGVVPFSASTAGAKSAALKTDQFSPEDRQIAALLGIKPADLETYGSLPDQITELPVAAAAK